MIRPQSSRLGMLLNVVLKLFCMVGTHSCEDLIESQSCSDRGACGFVLTANPDPT